MPRKGQPGPQHNAEVRKKISIAVRKAYAEGRLIHWTQTSDKRPPGFRGPHSEETKKKISESRKGKCIGNTQGFTKNHIPWNKGKEYNIHNDEWRKKVSEANRGPNHWNWQGGRTEINQRARSSGKYKEWRRAVYRRDNWTCQICHKKQQRFTIIAHHIKPWKTNKELRYDVNNGVTLCRKCHCAFHKPRTGTGKSPMAQST